jgi:hypothetical protein
MSLPASLNLTPQKRRSCALTLALAFEEAPPRLSPVLLELNLDTFDSFIRRRYPDRDQADRGTVSELVEELNAVGIDTIERWKSCWPGAMSNSRNTSRT